MPRRKFKMNLEELSERFLLPAGDYVARLVEVIEEPSSKGHPMLTWTWSIMVGAQKGKEVKTWTSLQDHALFGLAGHLKAFGLSGDVEFDPEEVDQYIGQEVRLKVVDRAYVDPETREKKMGITVTLSPLSKAKQAAPSAAPKKFDEDDIPF